MSQVNYNAVKFPAGTIVFQEGDWPEQGYLLVSGEVEISIGSGKERVVLTKVGPRQLFGEMALLDAKPRSATATAVTACEALALSRQEFNNRMNALDAFSRYWILYLSDRVRDLTAKAEQKKQQAQGAK